MLSVILLLIRHCLSLGTPQEKRAGNEEYHHDRRVIQCWFSERAQNNAEAKRKSKVKDLHDNSKLNVYLMQFRETNTKGVFSHPNIKSPFLHGQKTPLQVVVLSAHL